ncbi:glycosyltransferase [Bacillus sp. MM2020_1]|nr:glycosyltransferase [Bacillus sp. MM2020_1]
MKKLKANEGFYQKYDKTFCVSEYVMKTFNGLFPSMKDKTSVLHNLIDYSHMVKIADKEEGFKDLFEGLRILTVG